jgi:hypothetical protein
MADRGNAHITISLTPAQVDSVVRGASGGSAPSLAALVAAALAPPGGERAGGNGDRGTGAGVSRAGSAAEALLAEGEDSRLSRSLLRGFSLLAGFGADGDERGIVELADELGMSASTAHRYALTLIELGLLERSPRSRKYRLPALA